MRSLSRAVALLAVTGCMSNAARVEKTILNQAAGTEPESPSTPIVESAASNLPLPPTPLALVDEIQTSPTPAAEVQSECEASKKLVHLPYFLKESSALVVGLDQTCKESKDSQEPTLSTNMSVVGVACTGSPGFITRRGHSTHNWEVVTFGMDLGCKMQAPEQVRSMGKQKLGIAADPQVVSFVPMMIEYWEFEKNNDAGLGSTPTLTASGGGAAQWKQNETKSVSFPIKLYGHSSTFGKDQPVYEARAILLPKSNQRQFQVQVEDMRLLSGEELKATQQRCQAKTRSESGCREAFENQ